MAQYALRAFPPYLAGHLREEGRREAARTEAVTRVVAWQLAEEMTRQGITKARLAELMQTPRVSIAS